MFNRYNIVIPELEGITYAEIKRKYILLREECRTMRNGRLYEAWITTASEIPDIPGVYRL